MAGTNEGGICFAVTWFFRQGYDYRGFNAERRIDAPQDSRKYGLAGVTEIASEGQILVSSTTEHSSTAADGKESAKIAASARKSRAATPMDEGHVSQVLRNVYQRAVDEDIPAEMLDLLSKLD
ncbi:NepR family anti-sigma factor [Sphingobium sp. RAC03]|uniref:NepR family anti-sigma factor n=1 Tax=Sphingobium sp. RAC03 TaxID=1843368 RepID=UPI0012375AEF|nr:NepR family anti-sigma factor [Sphingobium sp. RAC03]